MPRKSFVLFSLNLWELSDQELDTTKDFALQGEVTESICLSVQNCSTRHQLPLHPKETYELLNLKSPKHRGSHLAHLLLPPSWTGAANRAHSLITKTREKRTFLVISFRLWTPVGQRWLSAIPGEDLNWQKEYSPTIEAIFLHPLLVCSSAGLDPTLSWPTPPHTFSGELRHLAHNSSLTGQDLRF